MSIASPPPAAARLDLRDKSIGVMAACSLLYLALAWISFIHPMAGLNITPWNPQCAIAVGLLIWRPRAWWLVWAAASAADVVKSTYTPWGATPLSAAALTAGYAVTAAVLTRWLGRQPRVVTRRDFVAFLLIINVGALGGAILHVLALSAFGIPEPARILTAIHRAWIGDAVGLLVTLPMMLVLADRERRAASIAVFRTAEWWLITTVAALCIIMVLGQPAEAQFKYFYLLFLPVVWAAARFGVAGAVWSAALVQVLLILGLQAGDYRPLTVFEFQVLMAALAATGLLLGTTVDEREQAERHLRESLRLAAAGDMAAALAHELNQPLMAMRNYARASQILAQRLEEKDFATAQPFSTVAGKLVTEASRAGEVVHRLRKFFRERATELQPTSLSRLVDQILHAHAARADSQKARLAWRSEHDLDDIWLDPVQIGIVLRNLVENALDSAVASQGRDGSAQVSVHASRDEDSVTLAVIDNGPGLSVDDTRLVFDRGESSKPGGMGIGLGISRSIVEAHGGRMWAEAGPGGKFYFTLPAPRNMDYE